MVVNFCDRHRSLPLLAHGEAFRRRTGVGHCAGDRLLSGAPTTGAQNEAARTKCLVVVRAGNPNDPGTGRAGDNCCGSGILRRRRKLAGKSRPVTESKFTSNRTPAPVAQPLCGCATAPSQGQIVEWLKGKTGSIAGQTLGFLGGALGIVVQMFFVVFTMYYLFRDGDRIFGVIRDALPLEKKQAEDILDRTRDVVGASVYGLFSIAIIQGTLGGLAFWFLGLPSAIVWGVAMIFLSLIPMLGAFLVWVPAAIYLFATGHYLKGIFLVLWGTLVIGMIDNFLRPKLVGDRTKLHELLIFFAVLGGLQVFGVLGIVLGPVVLAITLALVDVFRAADRAADS